MVYHVCVVETWAALMFTRNRLETRQVKSWCTSPDSGRGRSDIGLSGTASGSGYLVGLNAGGCGDISWRKVDGHQT